MSSSNRKTSHTSSQSRKHSATRACDKCFEENPIEYFKEPQKIRNRQTCVKCRAWQSAIDEFFRYRRHHRVKHTDRTEIVETIEAEIRSWAECYMKGTEDYARSQARERLVFALANEAWENNASGYLVTRDEGNAGANSGDDQEEPAPVKQSRRRRLVRRKISSSDEDDEGEERDLVTTTTTKMTHTARLHDRSSPMPLDHNEANDSHEPIDTKARIANESPAASQEGIMVDHPPDAAAPLPSNPTAGDQYENEDHRRDSTRCRQTAAALRRFADGYEALASEPRVMQEYILKLFNL